MDRSELLPPPLPALPPLMSDAGAYGPDKGVKLSMRSCAQAQRATSRATCSLSRRCDALGLTTEPDQSIDHSLTLHTYTAAQSTRHLGRLCKYSHSRPCVGVAVQVRVARTSIPELFLRPCISIRIDHIVYLPCNVYGRCWVVNSAKNIVGFSCGQDISIVASERNSRSFV